MKLRLCILSEGYPADGHPYFAFVQNLCENIVKQGHEVTVIAPQSFTKMIVRKRSKLPLLSYRNGVRVFRPLTVSFSNYTARFNSWTWEWAIHRVLKKINSEIDVYYGHFWHSAFALYPFAKLYKKPLFVATGECEIEILEQHSIENLKTFIDYVRGVICVSSKNKEESISYGLSHGDNCIVLPNAIDNNVFKIGDRIAARKKFGATEDDFVVAFVGGFVERKGPNRVARALKKLDDSRIKAIFVGYYTNGVLEDPQYEGTIFKGSLEHEKVAEALNAADLYVMPTLHEGCCNSIVEAMACGLPVVSSDRSFNYDVLNENNSILVEPMDVDAIASAVQKIKGDKELRIKLQEGALLMASTLTISQRANNIVKFIESNL